MYHDDDPYLSELREICLALPEATEVEAWGRPTFRGGKMFAVFTGSEESRYSVIFKPEPEDHDALGQDRRCYVPAYFGTAWIALDFTVAKVDWIEVAELMEGSY